MSRHDGGVSDAVRFDLAVKTFEHTARYDGAIANYLGTLHPDGTRGDFPRTFNSQFHHAQAMRYGENPHQKAAFYVEAEPAEASVATAHQIQGKALSYNNIADTDAALECVKQFDEAPACVIVKHANPCGVALGADLLEAYDRAYQTDPESAFGGIIAFNQPLDADTARAIVERQFVEVIIAPAVSDEAATVVAEKKNVRLLACGQWPAEPAPRLDFKRVNGGLLVQDADLALYDELKVVTRRAPSEQEMTDLLFTWKVAKFVKSNAIVYGRDRRRPRPGRRSRDHRRDPARRLHARRGSDRRRRRAWHRHGVHGHAAFPALNPLCVLCVFALDFSVPGFLSVPVTNHIPVRPPGLYFSHGFMAFSSGFAVA